MDTTPASEWLRKGLGYRSNAEVHSFLSERVARGGQRRRVGTSVEGRPIESCEWALAGSSPDSPCLFLLSLVHPMEWIGREIHLALIDALLDGRIEVPPGTRLVSLVDPNPDGTARVEAALRAGKAAWVRGNARGVDLNRNFPVDFRTRPRWIDFWPMWRPGPSPLSEPESRAILAARNATDSSHPAVPTTEEGPGARNGGNRPTLTLSLHSFGRWIFYPPSSARTVTPASKRHEAVLARVLAGTSPRGYRTRQLGRYATWFRAFGTEIDSLIQTPGQGRLDGDDPRRLAYLVELSWGGFGRWGLRRLHDPFFTFNPPHPEREFARLDPLLPRLISEGLCAVSSDCVQRPAFCPPSG